MGRGASVDLVHSAAMPVLSYLTSPKLLLYPVGAAHLSPEHRFCSIKGLARHSAVRFSSSPPPLSGRQAFRADARPASNLASLCSKDTNLEKIVPNFRQLSSSYWEFRYLSRTHTLTDYRGVSAFARARARMPQGCGHHRGTCKHIRSMHPTSTDSTASKNVAKSAA